MPTAQELNVPDKLDSILTTKQAIREAIVAKGVEVPEGTTFREYAEKINEIISGGLKLKEIFTGNLAEPGRDFIAESRTFLLFGAGRTTEGTYPFVVYYKDGREQDSSFNYHPYLSFNVERATDDNLDTIGYDISINSMNKDFICDYDMSGASPIFFLEGEPIK